MDLIVSDHVTLNKSRKIGEFVASIMALDRCLGNEDEPQESVYDERGLLVYYVDKLSIKGYTIN